MGSSGRCLAVTDHIFTPTFIDDIASVLALFLDRNLPGIYHVVGSSSLSTYDAVKLITKIYSLKGEVTPITREKYFKNRAFRPFKLALSNDKIRKLGFKMSTFQEGLKIINKQDL